MESHETQSTLSLNEARSFIVAMSKPMGEAVEQIDNNLKKINDVKEKCKIVEADMKSFQAEHKLNAIFLNWSLSN